MVLRSSIEATSINKMQESSIGLSNRDLDMETPFRNVTPNTPGGAASLLIALLFSSLILITQALFVVPAGQVGVVTTLGKVTGGSRLPGLNLKIPFIQAVAPFDVRTQVRPEKFASLTKDLQVIEATATVKYAVRPNEAGRVYSTIASKWSDISELVERAVADELDKFDYVEVRGLDLTGLVIAEEYRAAIEQKQIAEQQLLRAQTEVKIAEQEAMRYETLNRTLDDQVLFKLFLDKWDGSTKVVPSLPGSKGGGTPVIVGGR